MENAVVVAVVSPKGDLVVDALVPVDLFHSLHDRLAKIVITSRVREDARTHLEWIATQYHAGLRRSKQEGAEGVTFQHLSCFVNDDVVKVASFDPDSKEVIGRHTK